MGDQPTYATGLPFDETKNSRISARDATDETSSTLWAEPLIDASGARSSWLTILRKYALCR